MSDAPLNIGSTGIPVCILVLKKCKKKEIVENDFNLNISRYVSTAEADEEIELEATHIELVRIEQEIRAARDRHNKYLKELGLPELP